MGDVTNMLLILFAVPLVGADSAFRVLFGGLRQSVRVNDEEREPGKAARPSQRNSTSEPALPSLAVGSNGGRATTIDRLDTGRPVIRTSCDDLGQSSDDRKDGNVN